MSDYKLTLVYHPEASARRRIQVGPGARIVRGFKPNGTRSGFCLWCGRRLKLPRTECAAGTDGRRGDYGDDAFCNLRCGYAFGVSVAALGHRLNGRLKGA